jgi:hypothetical protein
MTVVIIKDMSEGNESVGEIWKETKIFEDTDTLADVLKWACGSDLSQVKHTRKNIVLTVPDNNLK